MHLSPFAFSCLCQACCVAVYGTLPARTRELSSYTPTIKSSYVFLTTEFHLSQTAFQVTYHIVLRTEYSRGKERGKFGADEGEIMSCNSRHERSIMKLRSIYAICRRAAPPEYDLQLSYLATTTLHHPLAPLEIQNTNLTRTGSKD
jgi:hypothetical protein